MRLQNPQGRILPRLALFEELCEVELELSVLCVRISELEVALESVRQGVTAVRDRTGHGEHAILNDAEVGRGRADVDQGEGALGPLGRQTGLR